MWKDQRDRDALFSSTNGDPYLLDILTLAESLYEFWSEGGWLSEYPVDLAKPVSPDQLSNSLLVVVSHFEDGESFYQNLPNLEKALVSFQALLVIEQQAMFASEQNHKGESDETLVDTLGATLA